ncbi:hypothetical protein ACFL1H_07685, partial [Nanoarchaeota archaeon]
MSFKEYIDEIVEILKSEKLDKDRLSRLKIKLCSKHNVKKIPTDIQILLNANSEDLVWLKKLLQTKPTRGLSGVAVVAIMSAPYKCPHGACIMCPSKTDEGVPQSYTGREPASMRGLRNKFDAYLQVFNRLEQYIVTGHVPDKIELIIMGGTFPSFPKGYQVDFVKDAFQAMNDFSSMFFKKGKFDIIKFKKFFLLPGEVGSVERTKEIHRRLFDLTYWQVQPCHIK